MSAIRSLTGSVALIFLLWGSATNILSASSGLNRQLQAARPSQSDLNSGKEIFDASCSNCHGLDATGGQAPNIQRVPATLGDDAVVKIIKSGVPGTGMPAFSGLSDAQATQIVAYIRSLASAAIAGTGKADQMASADPLKGKAIYSANGCANCHTISGDGGELGPDLTQIGSVRSPDYLRAALQNPGANLPKSGATGVSTGKWTEYLMFRAVTKDGRTVEGMRMSETSFATVLEDSQGNYHSLQKPDLKTLEKEPGKSFMPQSALSGTDLDNLVAYLASLKGAQ